MQKQREHWGTHIGFIMAAAGSAIGLGTLWKFPYVAGQNGGGLFVLLYIFFTFFIGIPIFIAELILGRRAQRAAVGIFATLSHNANGWKIVGWLGVASSFLIMSFYSVVAGWGLNYVLMSLNQFYLDLSSQEITEVFSTLSRSGDITIFWHLAFTALTVAVVFPGVRNGIEYWSKFMTSSLLILLLLLVGYSVTLDGFYEAVSFIFYPDYSNFKASGALEALGLSFFTLSLGQGIMLTYGSYMRRKDDIPKTALIIGVMIVAVSLLVGLMIFPIIFTFGGVPKGGYGMLFQTLPVLFAKLPGALFISTIFFILFVFTALTSSVALVEVVVANCMDLWGWSRKKSVLIVGISCFLFGIPSALSNTDLLFKNWVLIYGKNFFETIDTLVSVWLLPLGGLLISIYVGFFLDKAMVQEEFQDGTLLKWSYKPWMFFIRYVAPTAILCIIFQQSGMLDFDALVGNLFAKIP